MTAEKNKTEAEFQKKFISWVRKFGVTCLKLNPGAGIPDGTPDYICLQEGFWFMLEFKRSKTAKFRPGQKQAIEKYNEMSYAVVVCPENEEEVKKELEKMLK